MSNLATKTAWNFYVTLPRRINIIPNGFCISQNKRSQVGISSYFYSFHYAFLSFRSVTSSNWTSLYLSKKLCPFSVVVYTWDGAVRSILCLISFCDSKEGIYRLIWIWLRLACSIILVLVSPETAASSIMATISVWHLYFIFYTWYRMFSINHIVKFICS